MQTYTSASSGQHTLLIAEHQEENRKTLKEILGCSYHLLFAEDGRQALQLLLESKDRLPSSCWIRTFRGFREQRC